MPRFSHKSVNNNFLLILLGEIQTPMAHENQVLNLEDIELERSILYSKELYDTDQQNHCFGCGIFPHTATPSLEFRIVDTFAHCSNLRTLNGSCPVCGAQRFPLSL